MKYDNNTPDIPEHWVRFGKSQQLNCEIARRTLVRTVAAHPNITEEEFRALYKLLAYKHGEMAATLAVKTLQISRASARLMGTLPPVIMADPLPDEYFNRSVSWGIQKVKGYSAGKLAHFLAHNGVLDRDIQLPARRTVEQSVRAAGTRYVRIPGPFACPFCLMLTSRGAVYASKELALYKDGHRGDPYHAGCHCYAMECFTPEDVPPFIYELQSEWTKVMGKSAEQGISGVPQRWRHYLLSSRPRAKKMGADGVVHGKNSVQTIRPVPSIFTSSDVEQIHAFRRGVHASRNVHERAYTAQRLRAMGVLNDGEGWRTPQGMKDGELEIAELLQARNHVPVQGCETLGQMTQERKAAIPQHPGLKKYRNGNGKWEYTYTSPDYVIGDVTADLKKPRRLAEISADKQVSKIKGTIVDGRKQADCIIVDSREAHVDRAVAEEGVLKAASEGKVQEILFIGEDDQGYYEVVWP